jgi:hypothetical protein
MPIGVDDEPRAGVDGGGMRRGGRGGEPVPVSRKLRHSTRLDIHRSVVWSPEITRQGDVSSPRTTRDFLSAARRPHNATYTSVQRPPVVERATKP